MKYSILASAISMIVLSQQGYTDNTELDKTVIKTQKNTPEDIRLVDAVEVDQAGMVDITDIVRHIPGVQVNDTGDRYNDSGFNMRGLEGDDVAITVDGLGQGETLSPPSFASYGMFGSNRNIIDLETVKEIKIVKGPNSVLAGSGALGGSVALTTKDPLDYLTDSDSNETAGRVKTGFDGRSDETLLSAAIANRTGGFESLLMYVARDGGETKAHDSGNSGVGATRGQADPYDIESASVLAKLAYNFSEHHRLGVVYEDADRDTTGEPLSRDSAAYYNFSADDEADRERIGIFYDFTDADTLFFDALSATVDIQEIFNHGVTTFAFDSNAFGPFPDRSNDILRMEDRSFEQDTLDIGIDFEKTLGAAEQHYLVYGLSYNNSSVSNELFDRRFATVDPASQQTQNVRDPSWVPETDKTQISVYALNEFTLNGAWSFTMGGRYETTEYEPTVDENFRDPLGVAVSDSDFSAFTGQLSAKYSFTDNQSISLLYAQGYKAPTTQDLYLDADAIQDGFVDVNTGDTFDDWEEIANPDLEAEKADSIELSYLWQTGVGYLKVNVFTTEYTNQIQNVTLTRAFGQTIEVAGACFRGLCAPNQVLIGDVYSQAQNVGETTVEGIELESAFYLNDNFYLSFSASHLEGEHDTARAGLNNKGDELTTVSPDSATLGLEYHADSGQWGGRADLTWTDGRDESDDLSFTSLNNGSGPADFPDSSVVLDLSTYYDITENFSLTANIYNVTDEEYTRWEVINGVRPGSGGFFAGASGDGIDRFTEPGRSFALYATYEF